MIDLVYGLGLAVLGFVAIMAAIIGMGRAIGYMFGPKEDR